MKNLTTIILGASSNEERYAYKAAVRLLDHGHTIINIGHSNGVVAGTPIELPGKIHVNIDTITIYVAPHNQTALYDYVLRTRPRRIIFNPGAENEELKELAQEQGIAVENACTLVLLATGQY
ncbi:CoA-binding protein [Mucilaginibacter gynuensis]|uniref:CoA-binding protein n=1 Tax=Mucilaginibacter gynuensis TaxID=1302236 RepID=A0ABP8GMD4_9SPHI